MRKTKRYSAKRIFKTPLRGTRFLIPKDSLKSSWKMRATCLEHRRVEGKRKK